MAMIVNRLVNRKINRNSLKRACSIANTASAGSVSDRDVEGLDDLGKVCLSLADALQQDDRQVNRKVNRNSLKREVISIETTASASSVSGVDSDGVDDLGEVELAVSQDPDSVGMGEVCAMNPLPVNSAFAGFSTTPGHFSNLFSMRDVSANQVLADSNITEIRPPPGLCAPPGLGAGSLHAQTLPGKGQEASDLTLVTFQQLRAPGVLSRKALNAYCARHGSVLDVLLSEGSPGTGRKMLAVVAMATEEAAAAVCDAGLVQRINGVAVKVVGGMGVVRAAFLDNAGRKFRRKL